MSEQHLSRSDLVELLDTGSEARTARPDAVAHALACPVCSERLAILAALASAEPAFPDRLPPLARPLLRPGRFITPGTPRATVGGRRFFPSFPALPQGLRPALARGDSQLEWLGEEVPLGADGAALGITAPLTARLRYDRDRSKGSITILLKEDRGDEDLAVIVGVEGRQAALGVAILHYDRAEIEDLTFGEDEMDALTITLVKLSADA